MKYTIRGFQIETYTYSDSCHVMTPLQSSDYLFVCVFVYLFIYLFIIN